MICSICCEQSTAVVTISYLSECVRSLGVESPTPSRVSSGALSFVAGISIHSLKDDVYA